MPTLDEHFRMLSEAVQAWYRYYEVEPDDQASHTLSAAAIGFFQEGHRSLDDVTTMLIGTYVVSAGYYDAYYLKAQRVRRRIADDFEQAWQTCDVLLTPTAPSAAFALGERQADPVAMYLNDVFTVTTNLAGLPSISLPFWGSAQKGPVGVMLTMAQGRDRSLLALCGEIEALMG